ncbi:MAG: winged helix-turn-helix transcriptional regulator [Candidatus Altiarchaeota archaeon]|nr:winged helix-turn-helix transcriptional regulator [Candidatus Altiarchaeota archaeon]
MASMFKTLGSEKRRKILKLLKDRSMHISGIARELDISVPVALRHVKKLEEAGLVTRTKLGNTHLISIPEDRMTSLDVIWTLLDEPLVLQAKKGTRLLDILSTLPGIEIRSTPHGSYIHSVDGRRGYFVYEINGKLSNRSIDACRISRDSDLEIKRLIPALDKKIRIRAVGQGGRTSINFLMGKCRGIPGRPTRL